MNGNQQQGGTAPRQVRTLFFPQPPAVEVRIAGPMGLGVFATRAILKGERILEEDPVFVRPWRDMTVNTPPLADIVMDVCDMFVAQGLHEGRLRQMEELHYDPHIAEDERIVGPARRFLVERVNPTLAGAGLQGDNLEYNATRLAKLYAIQHSSGYTPDKVWGTDILSGVFPVYARINHSCIPNARPEYSFAHKRLEVYANRDIQPGEQIFRTYVELMGRNTEERGQELDDDYGIDECFCAMCENPETDELQTQIYKMYYGSFLYVFPNEIDDDDLTMEIEVAEDEDQCLEMAEKALELMTHPDIDLRDEWPRNMYRVCGMVCERLVNKYNRLRYMDKATGYAACWTEAELTMAGYEHPRFKEANDHFMKLLADCDRKRSGSH